MVPGGTNATPSCTGTQLSYVIGDGAEHDGFPTMRFQPLCSVVVDLLQDGDRIFAYLPDSFETPTLAVDEPVEDGHSWEARTGIQFYWEDAGTVQVPAGTFQDCWRRRELPGGEITIPGYVTYCRGIGAVEISDPDDGYEAELVSKNF